jgi:hypothetical protein
MGSPRADDLGDARRVRVSGSCRLRADGHPTRLATWLGFSLAM